MGLDDKTESIDSLASYLGSGSYYVASSWSISNDGDCIDLSGTVSEMGVCGDDEIACEHCDLCPGEIETVCCTGEAGNTSVDYGSIYRGGVSEST